MRACARYQACCRHELLSNIGATNIDHRPGVVALGLGGLAEHREQWIGFHAALVAPEAQAHLATRTNNPPGLAQGLETVAPDASEAGGHIKTRWIKGQGKHITGLDHGLRSAHRRESS